MGSKSSRNARTNRNRKDQSVRRVFGEVAQSAAYDQYAKVGFAFFKLCRNGLAHGFYPNDVQLANGPKGGVAVTFWLDVNTQRSICADEIGPPVESGYLVHWPLGNEQKLLKVSAQHLYRDVNRYIEEFLVRLHSEPELQQLVEQNDQRLLDAATRAATDGLEDRDFISLGL